MLGGAFNPPHIGHLVLAQEALVQLGLDSVVLMPMGRAPHREIQGDPGAEIRLALCEVAAAGDDRLAVSRLEVDREGPSYTLDTLRALRTAGPDDAIVWLLGGDQAAALPSWHEPEEVLRLCTVAATARGGWDRAGVAEAVRELPGADRLTYFEMPPIGVSSSLVRERVARGLPIRYLVPDAVAEEIESRGLYRSAAPVGAS